MVHKDQQNEKAFKIVVVGNSGVGKTNLVHRYTEDEFEEAYRTTVGLDFKFKDAVVGGENCKIQIWDTAGQEKLKAIASSYYKNSNGVALIFDLTNHQSFEKLDFWLHEAKSNVLPNVPFLLIGNKNDLISERCVSIEEAKEYAEKNSLFYAETSAKTNEGNNVMIAFEQLIGDILNKVNKEEEEENRTNKKGTKLSKSKFDVANKSKGQEKKWCC